MSLTIRLATDDDAEVIACIYNQGIAERGATFETEPRSVDDIAARLREQARFPTLVAEIAARPGAIAVTVPFTDTLAMVSFAECQVTGRCTGLPSTLRGSASSTSCSPTSSDSADGVIATVATGVGPAGADVSESPHATSTARARSAERRVALAFNDVLMISPMFLMVRPRLDGPLMHGRI